MAAFVLSVVVIIACVIGFAGGNDDEAAQDEAQQETVAGEEQAQTTEEAVTEEPAQPVVDYTVPDVLLEENAYPQVNELIGQYFNAMTNGDTATITSLRDTVDQEELIKIEKESAYIDEFDGIKVYTKPGPMTGSYVTFVYYEIKFTGIETLAPGLTTLYLCPREDGSLYICDGNMTQQDTDYIKAIVAQTDVTDLFALVETKYAEAIDADAGLNEFMGNLSAKLDAEWLRRRFASKKAHPSALYITSPDYLGNIEDIEALAAVCHENGVLLLVDNAHGAYLKFLTPSRHPIDLGADIVCDSAHKTLHALTGGAYLHLSKRLSDSFKARAKAAMSLFASTSPSYLILASLDKLNERLFGYREELSSFLPAVERLKEKLFALGYELFGDEPLKIAISAKKYGYFGHELAEALIKKNIYPEFYDRDFLVLMLAPDNSRESLEALYMALASIERRTEIKEKMPTFSTPVCKFSPREAVFSPFDRIEAQSSFGRVLAVATVSCPPAVPILMPGEVIDEGSLFAFEYYGINEVFVLKAGKNGN